MCKIYGLNVIICKYVSVYVSIIFWRLVFELYNCTSLVDNIFFNIYVFFFLIYLIFCIIYVL